MTIALCHSCLHWIPVDEGMNCLKREVDAGARHRCVNYSYDPGSDPVELDEPVRLEWECGAVIA